MCNHHFATEPTQPHDCADSAPRSPQRRTVLRAGGMAALLGAGLLGGGGAAQAASHPAGAAAFTEAGSRARNKDRDGRDGRGSHDGRVESPIVV